MPPCDLCQKIDIRAMYDALSEHVKKHGRIEGSPFQFHRDVDLIPMYKHHNNILDIEKHSHSCDLCALIWRSWAQKAVARCKPSLPITDLDRVWAAAKDDTELVQWFRGPTYLVLVEIVTFQASKREAVKSGTEPSLRLYSMPRLD
jgi:hypothetical protein